MERSSRFPLTWSDEVNDKYDRHIPTAGFSIQFNWEYNGKRAARPWATQTLRRPSRAYSAFMGAADVRGDSDSGIR